MPAIAATNNMNDAELKNRLVALAPADAVYVVLTKSNALVCKALPDGSPGGVIGQGDLGKEAMKELLQRAQRSTVYCALKQDATSVARLASLPTATQIARADLKKALERFYDAAFGRAGEVKEATARTVQAHAGWRCQFDGCGAPLGEHGPTGTPGNFAYLAHIVAASPDGPRGSQADSARLANDPDNILLLCDGCHRLVDRIEPDKYTVEVLRAMRDRSVVGVKELLDSLAYDEYTVLTVIGDVAGQTAVFDKSVAYQAMRNQRMRPAGEPYSAMRGALDQPNNTMAAHWQAQQDSLQHDVTALKGMLNGASRNGREPDRLAVFPLHNTSKLVLAGRVVGEGRTVRLFQYRRDPAGGIENQWSWPNHTQIPGPDAFRLDRPGAVSGSEGLLLFFLTDTPSLSDLPDDLRNLPTWRLTAATPGRSVIDSPDCLDRVARLVDEVLTDAERSRLTRLHVVAIAPATANFRLGQKLQSRHHITTTLYERSPMKNDAGRQPFVRTIEISTGAVNLGGEATIRI